MPGRGGKARPVTAHQLSQSVRAFKDECDAARESRQVQIRFGTRVLDEVDLEKRAEAKLNEDEEYTMTRIYDGLRTPPPDEDEPGSPKPNTAYRAAPKSNAPSSEPAINKANAPSSEPAINKPNTPSSEPATTTGGTLTKPNTPSKNPVIQNLTEHAAAPVGPRASKDPPRSGEKEDEGSDDEEFRSAFGKLSLTMQKYVSDCNNVMKSISVDLDKHPEASFSAIIEDRKSKNVTVVTPSSDEVNQAIEELRRLSMEPGGRERGWKEQLKLLRAAFFKKNGRKMPPEAETQSYFLWESSRQIAASHLPENLQHTTIVDKHNRSRRKPPPEKLVSFIFDQSKHHPPKSITTTTKPIPINAKPSPPIDNNPQPNPQHIDNINNAEPAFAPAPMPVYIHVPATGGFHAIATPPSVLSLSVPGALRTSSLGRATTNSCNQHHCHRRYPARPTRPSQARRLRVRE